jgi:hypothetical protein
MDWGASTGGGPPTPPVLGDGPAEPGRPSGGCGVMGAATGPRSDWEI